MAFDARRIKTHRLFADGDCASVLAASFRFILCFLAQKEEGAPEPPGGFILSAGCGFLKGANARPHVFYAGAFIIKCVGTAYGLFKR
jgi:hypothetical protein